MTDAEAKHVTLVLLAAFPYPRQPATTERFLRDKLRRLDDVNIALEAVDALTDMPDITHLPRFAIVKREYDAIVRRRAAERARLRGLAEPPADLAAQAAQARQLLERLRARVQVDATRTTDVDPSTAGGSTA